MFDALANLLAPPVLERLTLLLNHVLRAEPAASARLAAHSGRSFSLQLANWPPLLPAPPALAWRVTPAGLLEWCGIPLGSSGNGGGALAAVDPAAAGTTGSTTGATTSPPSPSAAAEPDLRISVDASNPALLLARAAAGERPSVQVEGDAAFAADIGWLIANLRWDVAGDLERLFGPVVAHQLQQVGRWLGRGLRGALDAAAASPLGSRFARKQP